MSFLINPYISFPTGSSSTLTDGIVNYYKLDGNSDDAVGSLDGTDTNVTYSTAAGKILSGGSYNGSSSITDVGDKWFTSFSSITVACWVKITYGTANDSFVSQYTVGATGQWLSFNTSITNGNIQWATDAGGTGGVGRQFVEVACSDGVWHHVVGVRDVDNAELRLYVDFNGATGVTTGVSAIDLTPTGGNGTFGKINDGGTYYQGDLDEVGIWNRALTEAEISELYNAGAGNQYPF